MIPSIDCLERFFLHLGGFDMKPLGTLAGVLWLAGSGLWAADTKQPVSKGDPRAAALLQEAAKTRYLWSPEITAVSGKIAWDKDGKSGAATFHSVLRKRGGLTFTADGDAQVPAEVKDHLASLIGHRVPPAPGAAERPQPEAIIIVEDEERGPLILTLGDAMHSSQRVKDGKLVQVNRLMGGKRFTIDVTAFEKAPDGQRSYPSAFTVTWWEAATGKKVEKQSYTTDGFHVIENQMFPKAEKVVTKKGDQTSTLTLRYSAIQFESGQPRDAEK
jgi:hypothetical protein